MYNLPGGRFAATSRGDQLRLASVVGRLLGRRVDSICRAGKAGQRRRLHDLEQAWARKAQRLLDIDLTMTGVEKVDAGRSYVVAPLHEGFADPIALLHLPIDLVFLARDELIEWPTLGRYLRDTEQVTVPTGRPTVAYRRMLEAAPTIVDRAESFVVFPQGSVLGIEVAFQMGAFRLAEYLQLPVLPIVLTGGHRVWDWPYSPLVRFGVEMRMQVLDPIESSDAVAGAPALERRMKDLALAAETAPARRYDPDRDGWWDEYPFEVDPMFEDVHQLVAEHRASGSGEVRGRLTPATDR